VQTPSRELSLLIESSELDGRSETAACLVPFALSHLQESLQTR
jgi:hypothetical protein